MLEKIPYIMKKDFKFNTYHTKCPYGNNCMVGHGNCWGCQFSSWLSLFVKRAIICKAGKHKERKVFELPPKPDPPPAPPTPPKIRKFTDGREVI